MKKILYINHSLSEKCGVYDLGLRHYHSISDINNYNIYYYEINNIYDYLNICNKEKPDGIIFNYMLATSPWIDSNINLYKCKKYCVPHMFFKDNFYFQEDPNRAIFDYFIILDNNSNTSDNVFKTNRPLIKFNPKQNDTSSDIPRIGGFGFAHPAKMFHIITREVNKTFDRAVINFHMPDAYFYYNMFNANDILNQCQKEITKDEIKIQIETNFLTPDQVVEKLNQNDLNCFFYSVDNDTKGVGISSSLDYGVSAQKPIIITESLLYRSFSSVLPKYPLINISDVFDNYEYYHNQVKNLYYNTITDIKYQTQNILDNTL